MIALTPRFFIGMRAWLALRDELDRVAPDEGLAVPLMALETRGGLAPPVQDLHLDQIKRVCIPRLFLVPAHLQRNRAARVHALPGADAALQGRIDSCLDLYPRLRPAGFIHSHPFARMRTWPSAGPGGDIEGHLLPLRVKNSESGLATSFSLIACRKRSGQAWRLQAFGLDRHGAVVDCGLVHPVPDAHPALRRALRGHAMQRRAGRALLRPWLAHAEAQGLRPELKPLFDGWLRCDLHHGTQRSLAVLLPPDFPRQAPLAYARTSGGWRSLPRSLPTLSARQEVA